MADQWTPVQETAPAPVTAGWTPVVEVKGPAERFYEKTPVKPVVDTLTADLEGKTGAEFAKQLAVNYGKSLTLLPAQTIANMGKSIWDGVANDHQAAVEAANKGDYVGAIRHVVNGAERIGNPLNSSLIQDTRESVRKDVGEGNLAGAAGTLLPWVAGEVPGMVKAAPGALKAAPGAIARAAESTEAAAKGAAGGIVNAAKAGELYPKGYSRFFPGVVAHQLGFPQVAALLEGGALAAPTLKAGMRGAKASLADLANARQLKALVEEGQRAPAVSPDVMSQFFEPDEIAGSTPPPNSEARVSPVPASAPASPSPSPSEPTVNLNQLAEFSTSDLAAAVKRMADRRAVSKPPPMAGGLPIEGPSPANVPITPGGQSTPLPVSPEVSLPTRQGPGTLADLVNSREVEGPQLPAGEYFHGTSAPEFNKFSSDVAYFTPQANEAGAFATNDIIGGGRGVGNPRTLKLNPAPGRVKDIQGAIDRGFVDDYSPDEIIPKEIEKARAEGYRYLTFKHPSSMSGSHPDFDAHISLFPKEDLAISSGQHTGTLADLANPKSLIDEGLKARRNAQREAKVNKVLKTFTDAGFTSDLVDKMSDMQWKGVAQKAGVNDLSSSQIDMVKAKLSGLLKDTRGSLSIEDLSRLFEGERVYRGVNRGMDPLALNKDGILYTSPNKRYAGHFGGDTFALETRQQNALDLRSLPHTGVPAEQFIQTLKNKGVPVSKDLEGQIKATEQQYGGRPFQYFANLGNDLRAAAQQAGYDSARINESHPDGGEAESLMLFNPKDVGHSPSYRGEPINVR